MVVKIEESDGGACISEILVLPRGGGELYGVERENAEVALAISLAVFLKIR